MHELAVCQSLLKTVDRVAAEHVAGRVHKIFLQIGPLSGVDPALLQAAFPQASRDTAAEGADMIIQSMPLRVQCKHCQTLSEASANDLTCRACGHWQTQLISGDELLIERIEMQTAQ
jgi:hydrogenase nickel incorporation protein HypA/HybF